jgi:hypothetical protein
MAAAEKNRSRASPDGQRVGDALEGETSFAPDLPRTRLNLVYKGTEMQMLLEKLQRLGHHGTVTDTIARALRVYEAFLDEREKGNQVVVQSRDGTSIMRLI